MFTLISFWSCWHLTIQADPHEDVLNETDTYREFAPPAHLRDSIACLWTRRGDGGTVRILPDACSDIVWRSGLPTVVAGPDTGPSFSVTRPGSLIVGVRFLPGAGGPALGLPLDQLRDQRVELSELGLDREQFLGEDLELAEALGGVGALAAQLVAAGPPDRAVQAATVRLLDPRQRVDRLAAEIGLSERQLRRRFRASVGYGPKTLQRILRLRRFLRSDRQSLGRAALDAGYADQAHLARDCRRLTGLAPSGL
jgi:AraC-like DNA-binding protein